MKLLAWLIAVINLTFLLSCASSVQGVSLKKNTLYIDGITTPINVDLKYNTPEDLYSFHQTYTFFESKSSTPFLIVDYKGVQLSASHKKEVWLEISDAKRESTNSVDFKGGALIFSKNWIISEMLNKYKFFNRSGVVDHTRITKFLESDVHADAKRRAANILEKKLAISKYLNAIDPYVNLDRTITKGGIIGEPIGRMDVLNDQRPTGSFAVGIYDLAENLIASAIVEPNIPTVCVSLINGGLFEYRSNYGLSSQVGGTEFLNELVGQVLLQGFSLGYSYDSE